MRITKKKSSSMYIATFWLVFLVNVLFFSLYAEYISWIFIFSSFTLATLVSAIVILYKPSETLSGIKIASMLYGASFSYAPAWLKNKGAYTNFYYNPDASGLMDQTSIVCLVGYIFFLLGYFLYSLFISTQASPIPELDRRQLNFSKIAFWVFLLIGFACYIILIKNSGGLSYIMGYSGGRADIFNGVYGGWFWGAHILFAAYGIYAVMSMNKHPWRCLIFAIIIACIFVPLQGRDLVIAPIFCWLIFFHILRNHVSWKAVGIAFFIIVFVSALVGAYRSGGNKIATKDPISFISSFLDNTEENLIKVVASNIEQFDTAMIAVRYVDKEDKTLGPMVLFSWIEPIDRQLFGNVISSIYSGVFMDLLIMPQHRGWSTALSPSLPGELYIGLSWTGICLGLLFYGFAFGYFARWLKNAYKNPLKLAAYPFVLYIVTKMIVDGTTHFFRALIVFMAVMFFATFLPRSRMPTQELNQ